MHTVFSLARDRHLLLVAAGGSAAADCCPALKKPKSFMGNVATCVDTVDATPRDGLERSMVEGTASTTNQHATDRGRSSRVVVAS